MADIFGLDFDTTNTLAAIIQGGRALSLTNRDDNLPHPSVVWYHGGEIVVGRRAKQHLTQIGSGVLGDVVRSPKAFLGSGTSMHVGGVAREPADVVAEILRFVRQDAISRAYPGVQFDHAVVTIPVGMEGRARRQLRDAALREGLHIVQFVHEPLAALYGYLRSQPEFGRRVAELEGQLVLVFDWGGGTLDLTLCRLIGGNLVQVQNRGDNKVGGDRFDERLLRHIKDIHARQHNIKVWPGEMPNADAKLIAECEAAKIALSDRRDYRIFVANYLRSDGPERTLEVVLSREQLIDLTKDLVLQGIANIDSVLDLVGIKDTSISLCLATGGMVKMPYIRERLLERFGPARTPSLDHGDRIIAEGAAWIANDGIRLRLAKPFEVLHADSTYVTLFTQRTALPTENLNIATRLGAYCVDPRDGFAKFQLMRPRWPGRTIPTDPRHIYANLTVRVDSTAAPLLERLELEATIDHDLVVAVTARSTLVGDEQRTEIQDLEFGLGINSDAKGETGADPDHGPSESTNEAEPGAIRLRSNICLAEEHDPDARRNAWHLVPGEILELYRNHYGGLGHPLTPKQQAELGYYLPCSWCHRLAYDINASGCDRSGCPANTPKLHRA